MSAKAVFSATPRGRTACVEVEEDLQAVALDRGTPPVVISVLASVGVYMQEIADFARSR